MSKHDSILAKVAEYVKKITDGAEHQVKSQPDFLQIEITLLKPKSILQRSQLHLK